MDFLKMMLGETAPPIEGVKKEPKKEQSAPVAPPEGKNPGEEEEKQEIAVIPPDADEFKLSTEQPEPTEEPTASATEQVISAADAKADGPQSRRDVLGLLLGMHNESIRKYQARADKEEREAKTSSTQEADLTVGGVDPMKLIPKPKAATIAVAPVMENIPSDISESMRQIYALAGSAKTLDEVQHALSKITALSRPYIGGVEGSVSPTGPASPVIPDVNALLGIGAPEPLEETAAPAPGGLLSQGTGMPEPKPAKNLGLAAMRKFIPRV